MSKRPDHLIVGATYWPANTGPYMWHELSPERISTDLAQMRSLGLEEARLHLAWDAFMPSHRQVSRARIRELETILDAARAVGIRLVPVLFAQSIGNCILLPAFAVDRKRPRRGVRVVSDQVVASGGPRDMYADPLMLEVEVLCLETLLDAFANHPAIAAWDLGHDPATTLRPRRIAHLAAWAELLGGLVRKREDSCRLTLGAGDIVQARGVRLAAAAPHVDVLGLAIAPQRLAARLRHRLDEAGPVVMLTQLAQQLASAAVDVPAILVELALSSTDESAPPVAADAGETEARKWDVTPLDPPTGLRLTAELVDRCTEVGVVGLSAAAWADTTERTFAAPPFDRMPTLARQGMVDTVGTPKPLADVWRRLANAEKEVAPAQPWPDQLDVEGYYAHLPDSVFDLLDRFRREYEEGGAGRTD